MPTITRFSSDDISYIKYHALRALCGLLMDRHSECVSCPFCGDSDPLIELIVNAIPNVNETGDDYVIGLYFCKARFDYTDNDNQLEVVNDWGAGVGYADLSPLRKAVVQPLDDGTYLARYGQIANPTEGDYSSGRLDISKEWFEFTCNPEPEWTQWRYWNSEITEKQTIVPEFLCLRLRGEWWILDRDREQKVVQQVAALTVADNPNHYFSGPTDIVVTGEDSPKPRFGTRRNQPEERRPKERQRGWLKRIMGGN